jgi:hypothetical protein
MNIIGVLSIRDGVGLGYPFTAVIDSLGLLCDKVIVGVDSKFPRDEAVSKSTTAGIEGKLILQKRDWDVSNIDAGSEIAIQMDILVKSAKEDYNADWVVVMQADEVLHENDTAMIREFCSRASKSVGGFSMERLYFWKNMSTIRKDWNADLIRIFRPDRFSFMTEGTDKAGMYSGPLDKFDKVVKLPYSIYHYSRLGDPSEISKRVRNLDGFFHPEESLVGADCLPDYDFVMREHDNYSKSGQPKEVAGDLIPFKGTHPEVVSKLPILDENN